MHPFIGFLLAFSPMAMPVSNPEIVVTQKIITASLAYGIDPVMSLEVAKCESGFKTDIVGDQGLAYGVFQFHRGTFDDFSEEAGVELDYKNPDHAIDLFMWAIKNGKGSHWTCYKRLVHRFS